MNIILGSDSLRSPLTGIGRYSFELAHGLLNAPEVETLTGYDYGRFHSIRDRLEELERQTGQAGYPKTTTRSFLRQQLSQSSLAARTYATLLDVRSRLQKHKFRSALYHSPNYHLPAIDSPSVTTVHDLTHHLFPQLHPRSRVAWMEKTFGPSLERSHYVICQSQATRNDLVSQFSVPGDKVGVIYPGVDQKFQPVEASETVKWLSEFGLDDGQYFLTVSTLEPRKNLSRMIDAYLRLDSATREQHPLVLVGGDGWASEALKAQIHQASGQGVRWLGYVSDQALPALYSAALCVIYPSLYEGFGLPVVEAQACGAPLIVSNRSSLPEVSNHLAISVTPEDREALLDGMNKAIADTTWRSECAHAGLDFAAQFTWRDCVAQTLSVYKNVLTN